MKTYIPYAVAAAITLVMTTFLTYFAADAGHADSGYDLTEAQISVEDIERATEQAFDDFQAQRLLSADADQLMVVRPLERDLRDLGDRQKEINNRIDAILNGDLKAKLADGDEDIEIPGGDKIDELVARAIVKFRDDQERNRAEEAKKRREERALKRRTETLDRFKTRLGLADGQVQELSALMIEMDEARSLARDRMREARSAGGNFDFRSMGQDFRKLREQSDQKLNGILNANQQASYAEYKKEDPFGASLSGFGGMRQRGGGTGRGRGNR